MKSKALLVGINQYPNPRNSLRGCVNDILDMEHFIAVQNKVYPPDQIKKLTDKEATKKEILRQLQWLLEDAEYGDQLLFHYSGHGAQLPCKRTGDKNSQEKDGLDEIICPYDYDGSDFTTIRDNDFYKLFKYIPKGVHFIWISDSCHSEDLSREPFVANSEYDTYFRNFGIYNRKQNLPAAERFGNLPSASIAPNNLQGALLSACASHQLSADAYIENRFNGAFTHYLIKNLNKYAAKMPIEKIIQLVNKDLEANGYDQNPCTEGLLENKLFFL
jgi:hypothetical protein